METRFLLPSDTTDRDISQMPFVLAQTGMECRFWRRNTCCLPGNDFSVLLLLRRVSQLNFGNTRTIRDNYYTFTNHSFVRELWVFFALQFNTLKIHWKCSSFSRLKKLEHKNSDRTFDCFSPVIKRSFTWAPLLCVEDDVFQRDFRIDRHATLHDFPWLLQDRSSHADFCHKSCLISRLTSKSYSEWLSLFIRGS